MPWDNIAALIGGLKFEATKGNRTMITKKIVVAIALLLGAALAAQAQSTYTTGTIASNEAAGYSSPNGYGSGLYGYAAGYEYGYGRWARRHRR
jgi:hypothetical protein